MRAARVPTFTARELKALAVAMERTLPRSDRMRDNGYLSETYVIFGEVRSGKNEMQILRNRRTGRPFLKKSKAAQRWLGDAHAQLLAQRGHRDILAGPYLVKLIVYQRRNACDLDNMVSLVNDALNGVVIEDDSQIQMAYNEKLIDATNPRVEITIRSLARA
jgi:crossover junction endodeoxyribonuclease RusA